MGILGQISAKQANEDPPSWPTDVRESPSASPILERLNISDHLNFKEGSKGKVRFFVPPLAQIFKDLTDAVDVTKLDWNLVQPLVMTMSIYGYNNIS